MYPIFSWGQSFGLVDTIFETPMLWQQLLCCQVSTTHDDTSKTSSALQAMHDLASPKHSLQETSHGMHLCCSSLSYCPLEHSPRVVVTVVVVSVIVVVVSVTVVVVKVVVVLS